MSAAPAPPPPSPELLAAWAAAEAEAERELAEADARAAEEAARRANGGAPVAGSSAPARRGGGRKLVLAAVLACAAGGAFGSKALMPKSQPEVTAEPEGADADESTALKKPAAPDPGLANRIDDLLRAGCYPEALAALRDAPPNAFGDEHPAAYREGLCLEGLGKIKDADRAYQKAEKDPNVGGWARALLGRARCAIADGAQPAARELVDRVLVRSGHPECRGGKIYEESVHLRAHLLLLEQGTPAALDALDATALAWPSLRASADKYLDWLTLDAPAPSPNPDLGRDAVEVHADTDARNPEVTVRLSRRPALDVVRAVAAAAQLEVQAEPSVEKLLTDLVGPVEVEHMPLDALLTGLTERVGVAWAIKGGSLALTRAPRPADADAAAAALRKALAAAPRHPAEGAARVALANLDARAGRNRAAELGYKQVLEGEGNPPELTHAAYNLGLLELKSGQRGSARARFLQVIDRSPKTRFADLGWCWIGRAHLESDDPGAAREAYHTALNGNTKEATSAAALALCACELLTNNDDAARALLEDTRFSTREHHAMLVSFYEALLRHRTAPTESRRELLLAALRRADECRGIGPGGVYLVGRVYAELGLAPQMTALYEREVETARGPLALRMLYDAAERYDRLDARKQARTKYLSLAAVAPDGLGALAELKLAALDARDGNGAEAVRRCRTLVTRPGVPRDELLRVMGQGYELQKMYGAAAECFAGRLPE